MVDFIKLRKLLNNLNINDNQVIDAFNSFQQRNKDEYNVEVEIHILEKMINKTEYSGHELINIISDYNNKKYYESFYNIFINSINKIEEEDLILLNYLDILFLIYIFKKEKEFSVDFEQYKNEIFSEVNQKKEFYIDEIFYL